MDFDKDGEVVLADLIAMEKQRGGDDYSEERAEPVFEYF